MLNPIKLFASPQIEVEWDDVVKNSLRPNYRTINNTRVPVRLFDLLKGLGNVQSKRLNPSLMKSLMDFDYLLELIVNDMDFKLRVADIKANNGSELLTVVSGDLGIGLSVVVASQLFDVDKSTICKIIGSGRRPDWTCLLKDGRVMLVESKGSTNQTTSNMQLKDAVDQKNHYQGNVRIATATLLNETVSTKMKIVDPPIIDDKEGGNMRRHVFRANHYASVFSFMGEGVLSLYFEKMGKRLSGQISDAEMDDKEMMYKELQYNAPSVKYGENDYAGHLYHTGDNQFIFIGVDKKLLSYRGFMDYINAEDEQTKELSGNEYVVYADGIFVVNVKNSDGFFEENHIESVGLGYDHIALSDVDSIRGSSFKRYVKYLLEKCGSDVQMTDSGSLRIQNKERTKEFVVFHVQNNGEGRATKWQLKKVIEIMEGRNGVLVTNLRLPKQDMEFRCIDRGDFVVIAGAMGNVNVVREIFMSV